VEELTQSLIRLVGENGMDWMFANCSATAQRGALDWRHKFREAVKPVFEDLYESVETGKETKRVIESCSKPDYMDDLREELDEIKNSEMWQAGEAVRSLRPENWEDREA
jgi:ketol-acid reductoisomerase